MNSPDMPSLESVWEEREERIYPSLFGPLSRGVFALEGSLFADTFRQTDIDPRWLHYGVLEFGPTSDRGSWLYVSTGFSNPWEQEPAEYANADFSGFGSELVLEVPSQRDWAIRALKQLLAYDILLAHGRFGEASALDYGDRVPLGGPINGDPTSTLRYVAVCQPTHYPGSFRVASGQVDLLHLVGITESERDHARQHGTSELVALLMAAGAYPVTEPSRRTIV